MALIEKYDSIIDETRTILINKNKDYGEAYKEFGLIGLLARINEKIKRCLTITKTEIVYNNDEKLKDTLQDLINYSILTLIELEEKK
jgi:hypothetical protein